MNQIIQVGNKKPRKEIIRKFLNRKKYQLQFIFSTSIAIIFLCFLFFTVYQNHKQERLAKQLLNNYQLTTLYSNSVNYDTSIENSRTKGVTPFVIGMIKIDKIDLNYPILSETNDELLKISLCRFTGPIPNQTGNLCIAGHNYLDTLFFGRLDELNIGDSIEIYDLYGTCKTYKVFKKYEVEANDLSCTKQNAKDDVIVTLLTCDNSNQNKRIVVQAK